MADGIVSSPHGSRPNRVDRIMLEVILALIPGTLAMIWYFGWGILINLVLAGLFAVLTETVALKLRRRPALPALRDLSALVTALLFALAVPPTLPWWLTLLGMVFAIGVAKQLYGGLGYNPFNPAMAGYVFLLVSYPLAMTSWLPPYMLAEQNLGFVDSVRLIFTGTPPAGSTWDAITMATPLDQMRTQLDQNLMIEEIRASPLWGDFGGRGWEWVGNWFLLGGVFLLWRRVISWHIPVSMLLGLLITAGFFWTLDPQTHPFPAFHLFSGGAILGAFFIATDPVSACTTPKGQLIFGAAIGVLVFVIRTWGGYPDAVAFCVLLMNIAAPTIDYYTQPRVLGHDRDT
ncbi:electron transport complex subunit RsxD [Candidatus Thiosymbion oneisti]|uniref:electron transport complex subunit RsxD n=1 Tax=Candidatus Thiosymbion oneisti TaxID=589554 RepID=UPI000A4C3B75|nr:electron transport complex subunit RsxD [Candidatus Thiosymbion oneisti]